MASSGVMPMPPPISTDSGASSTSAKWLRGTPTSSTAPACSAWCNQREPPRLLASRLTAMQ